MSKLHCWLLAVCMGTVLPLTAWGTAGQPGTLDPTWAPASAVGAGRVITPVGVGEDSAAAAAADSDGRVLVVGRCQTNTFESFCVIRYGADGSLDPAWNGGSVITQLVDNQSQATAVAVQPDGKVLVTGSCLVNLVLRTCTVRYDSSGVLDPAWNGTGVVVTQVGGFFNIPSAVALQADGKVLVAGTCSNGSDLNFCTLRFTANGAPDTTWNATGVLITPVGSGADTARAIAVQPDGKVIVGGYCSNGSNDDFCVVRYLTDGSLDTTWASIGKVITAIGPGNDQANAMVLQPDGRVLLAGACSNGSNTDFCALRYLANGTLDTSWNGAPGP